MDTVYGNCIYPEPTKTMKHKGLGHLKTRLFTIKTSKHVGFGGSLKVNIPYIACLRMDFYSSSTLRMHLSHWAADSFGGRISWEKKSAGAQNVHLFRIKKMFFFACPDSCPVPLAMNFRINLSRIRFWKDYESNIIRFEYHNVLNITMYLDISSIDSIDNINSSSTLFIWTHPGEFDIQRFTKLQWSWPISLTPVLQTPS